MANNKNTIITVVIALVVGLVVGIGVTKFTGNDNESPETTVKKESKEGQTSAGSQKSTQNSFSGNVKKTGAEKNQQNLKPSSSTSQMAPELVKKGDFTMINLSNSENKSVFARFVEDKQKNTYAYWTDYQLGKKASFVLKKKKGLKWSDVEIPENIKNRILLGVVKFDSKNNLHLVFLEKVNKIGKIYYVKRANGKWTVPFDLSVNVTNAFSFDFHIDSRNEMHVIWSTADEHYAEVLYTRTKKGQWMETENITPQKVGSTFWFPSSVVDGKGQVHVAFHEVGIKREGVYYMRRDTKGNWSEAVNVMEGLPQPSNSKVLVDKKGKVHVLCFAGSYKEQDVYLVSKEGDKWSSPLNISNSGKYTKTYGVTIDDQNRIQLGWSDYEKHGDDIYWKTITNGTPSKAVRITENQNRAVGPSFFVAKDGSVYLNWHEFTSLKHADIYYTKLQ